jgi:3-methyladenine DNA glycosylase AlkC
MKDSLLSEKDKRELLKFIKEKKYSGIISTLEKIRTNHAGTAKTKDKRYVVTEIVKSIIDNSKNREKDFLNAGSFFCNRKEDVSKEIGISLVWRGYKFNPEKVKTFLLKIADDSNWEVREYAATAFADTLYYNGDFYQDLMKWTKHSSENVRRAVVFSAIGLKNKENLSKAFSILEPLMFDNSKYVKKNLGPFILGSHFGNWFPKETLGMLKKWRRIRDENVRWNIIMSFHNSFGNKYPDEALDVLKYFIGDADMKVKRALMSTLNFLNKRHNKLVETFKKNNKLNLSGEAG